MHLPSQITALLTLLTLTSAAAVCKRQEGTSISLIGSARRSAFYAASSAFVAATPQPNSIICPGVIGAAPTASEPAGDNVRLRTDPSAISALEQRQSIRPYQSRNGNRRTERSTSGQTATPVVEGGEQGEVEEPKMTGIAGVKREAQGRPMDPPYDVKDPMMSATPTMQEIPSGTSY
ncbi:hypothetical protein D6C90_03239 [Aureobasidium pullulans]|uniref:Uncharacterized protein n=1 Tax=Aureobasidium pullulans TaxID=5580 RepID=A0A4S9VD69_AURPU|nr:hypothetical protein D6C90_03239 [Aureobasidium pullulans]